MISGAKFKGLKIESVIKMNNSVYNSLNVQNECKSSMVSKISTFLMMTASVTGAIGSHIGPWDKRKNS